MGFYFSCTIKIKNFHMLCDFFFNQMVTPESFQNKHLLLMSLASSSSVMQRMSYIESTLTCMDQAVSFLEVAT